MNDPLSPTLTPRDHLIIPPNPVPNGSLHLGHMAGPYLRLDFLSRHLRRRGDRTRVIFGTHPYDAVLTLKATQVKRPHREVAAHYFPLLVRSLEGFDIGFDTFIDPLSPVWAERFDHAYLDQAKKLQAMGKATHIEERLAYDHDRGVFLTGCDFLGRCPECDAGMGGFICEECGSLSQPTSLRDPHPSNVASRFAWEPVENLFFQSGEPDTILQAIAATETPLQFQEVCARHFRQQPDGRIRMSLPGTWGVDWPGVGDTTERTLVDSGFLFGYCYLCGEIYSDLTGLENPFHADSSTITVNGFGLDNVITHMVYMEAMAQAQPGMRSFDRFLVNHFYLLEGEKFSTSRGHAIWAHEMIEKTSIPSDALRYCLAKASLSEKRESFHIDLFLQTLNEGLAASLYPAIERAFSRLDQVMPAPAPAELSNRLRSALQAQEDAFDYARFDPRGVVETLDHWIQGPPAEDCSPTDAYWWLRAFSLLAEPIMPRLSREIWLALGAEGEPRAASALRATVPKAEAGITPFHGLRRSELAPCLPPTLTGADTVSG